MDFSMLKNRLMTELSKVSDNVLIKPCLVFDIDGTIIYEKEFRLIDLEDNIIMDVYKLLLYAQNVLKIPIVIITARFLDKESLKETKKLLKRMRIKYVKLYLMDEVTYNQATPHKFKREARKELVDEGFTPLMSFGDNYGDYGEHGGIGVHIYNNGETIKFIN